MKRAALTAPKGHDVRPTTDRVREALFNLLRSRFPLEGASVLDLFAGTGALGFEALSRGAERVVFVEADAAVLRIAKQNAKTLNVEDTCTFVRADALKWLRNPVHHQFDLIFADPPYDLKELRALPGLVEAHLGREALFVLEHDTRQDFDDEPSLAMSRAYGRTVVSMFTP